MLLKGLIEPPKEIAKLQKKLEFLRNSEKKLSQLISAADYTTKVPLDIQGSNAEKLTQMTTEMERLQAAIESLNLMSC